MSGMFGHRSAHIVPALAAATALIACLLASPIAAQDAERATPDVLGWRCLDVEGATHRLGGGSARGPVVLVFLGIGCPIGQRTLPDLARLHADALERQPDLGFYGVVSDPNTTRREAAEFADEFRIPFPVLFDASGDLARALAPTHVPRHSSSTPLAGSPTAAGSTTASPTSAGLRPSVESEYLRDALVAVLEGRRVEQPAPNPSAALRGLPGDRARRRRHLPPRHRADPPGPGAASATTTAARVRSPSRATATRPDGRG